MSCFVCKAETVKPFAIFPGTDAEIACGIMIRRPIADRVLCSVDCYLRQGGSHLTSERTPRQPELTFLPTSRGPAADQEHPQHA